MSDRQPYKVIILIPVYNGRIPLKSLVPQLAELGLPGVILDDGSTDGLSAADVVPFTYHRFDVNRGKGAVLKDGLELAKTAGYDFAITMDADGQHPVASVPNFLKAITSTNNFIVGRRDWNLNNMPWARILSNTITSWLLSRRTGLKIHDSQIGFRCYPLVNPHLWRVREGGFQFESAVFLRVRSLGLKLKWVDVPVVYAGEPSHMNHWCDTWQFIRFYIRSFWRDRSD
ncbi:MAG: glycosyltransferase family 2 protein [Candidatus Marinimicrobia bacterium]|nr:glycosyltransferase family 2 protein [Candidatus Neomarinimicrobiota bacterium]MCF7902276.1 glycosyltransferase family 2 protein [Candidatus Neomarinimicrobiota bacterium]